MTRPLVINVFNMQPDGDGGWIAFGTYTSPSGRSGAFRRWVHWVPTRSETTAWLEMNWRQAQPVKGLPT